MTWGQGQGTEKEAEKFSRKGENRMNTSTFMKKGKEGRWGKGGKLHR